METLLLRVRPNMPRSQASLRLLKTTAADAARITDHAAPASPDSDTISSSPADVPLSVHKTNAIDHASCLMEGSW
jgi:hypothetical protein